jgi:serine/threonine protein kinase/tetratricopeptide (TPR) repeat protein
MSAPERLSAALSDRYRIERELGQGGMAMVYLAEDLKHRRKVAVKVLRSELSAALGPERFLREIETTANLRHPHILPLYDSGEADGFLFYVMPLVEGESLRDRLDREKQLPVDAALQIAREVADALSYAHTRGVIHRDIKPENILLEGGHAVVADFGIAKAVRAAGGESLTRTGTAIGTPAYMSPEQAAGEQDLDGRSDLYALACVLYEMLAGQPPFTGATAEILVRQHMAVDAPPITNYRPAVPAAVAAALQRALAKTPADRFNPVAQFSEALRLGAGASPIATTAVPAAPQVGWLKRHKVAAATVLVTLLLGAIGLRVYLRGHTATTAIDSIVVLPFENRSNDADVEYISDGLTESISNSLTQLPGLKVIPTSVAFHYKGKAMNPQQVGDELHIAAVLTGRVTQRGDSLLVSVELDDVRRGSQLWGSQYNRLLADLLAVQRDIATEVSQRLGTQPSEAGQQRLQSSSTDNPEAYQLYLKGNYFTAKNTKDGYDKGVAYFKQALAIDSNYALALDGLAFNYMASEDWFVPPREAAPLAKAAARRALVIDSTLASAHQSLGMVAHWYDWEWAVAEREFTRAIDMRPTDPRPHEFYAWFLATVGRFDQAVAEAKRAQQLEPVSVEASDYVGAMLTLAHRYDEAIVQLRATIDLDPTYFYAYDWLGRAYEQTGRMPEAVTAYQKAVELEPVNAENSSNLGHAYAVSGKATEARQIINDLKATSARTYLAPYNIALIYAGLGDKDQAFAWLERAYDDRSSLLVLYMGNDARWDLLHSDPRYVDLAKRIGLPPVRPVAGKP